MTDTYSILNYCVEDDCYSIIHIVGVGLCKKHYLRFRADVIRQESINLGRWCVEDGCSEPVATIKKGLCGLHYGRQVNRDGTSTRQAHVGQETTVVLIDEPKVSFSLIEEIRKVLSPIGYERISGAWRKAAH
ncbi:hypothetical protein IFU30_11040 [Plantibacter sp. CFBP 8798]|uniref:hypothetical protein n=1 Tax=Plantibacter sp. CFBP 8798 TaxID=2775268 RepID=UPI001783BC28|nr:hypothetical protein [Plantibacter sp. CFBP 8798]MBD8466803.1 hypothetical protein [Plantibacter sp. CFBP 8798]